MPSASSRRLVTGAFLVSIATTSAPAPAAAGNSAGDLPPETLSSVIVGFVGACAKSFNGTSDKSDFGAYYCPCAAAFISERFTLDEMSDTKNQTSEAMEKLHPGTLARLKSCAQAATRRNEKP